MRNLPALGRAIVGASVGAVLLSTEMTVFSLAGLRWNVPVLLATALLVSIVLGRYLAAEPEPASRASMGAVCRVAALVSAASIAVVVLSVIAGASTSGDFIMFWGPKAQVYAQARTIDASTLRDPWLAYMQPAYPPLVANVYALVTMLAGRMPWGAATSVFPLILAALALALPGLLHGTTDATGAGAASTLVVAGLGLVGMEADSAGNGDLPLFLFEALAMALLVRRDARTPAIQILAGLLLAGAASTKIEGLPFAVAAAALFPLLRRDLPSRPLAAFRLLLPAVVALGAWFVFGASRGLFRGYAGYYAYWKIYPSNLPGVVGAIGYFLWRTGYAAPYLFPLLFLALRSRPWRPTLLPLGVGAALSVFLLLTYLHNPDPYLWVGWSAPRVYAAWIPLLAIAGVAGTDVTPPGLATVPTGSSDAGWPTTTSRIAFDSRSSRVSGSSPGIP